MSHYSPRGSRIRSWLTERWPLIVVNGSLVLIGLILAAPLLQNAALCTDDGALHIYRTVALDRALQDGLLYPRWFPDLAYGYGFPFFNYREPLGYYLVEFAHLLGANVPLALNLILAGGLIASGLTMSAWVSDVFDRPAGFVAGVVYMAAPYTLIDALVRGNLPETLALALMPAVLWSFRRLLLQGSRKYFFLAVASFAALLLTHNISSLIFTPILLAYIFVVRGVRSAASVSRGLRITLLAFVISLALTSFFWLPALLEGQAAQLYLTHSARGNDYHYNFLSLEELIAGPGTSDPLLLNPPLRIVLGWVPIALAVLGVALIPRMASREQRVHAIIAAVAALAFIFMALPISLALWDSLPLIRFVQFPWRFVGRAILPIALLAGAGYSRLAYIVRNRAQVRTRKTQYAANLGVLLVFTLPVLAGSAPLLYPRVCPGPTALTIRDVFAYEHATHQVGVDPLGAYLPVTVKERPDGSPLEAQYAANETIKRFDRSALPAGAQVLAETYQPNRAEIRIDTPGAFRAAYLAFDFPGWMVSIDGQPAPIVPSDPNGLITFDVPAGQHRIDVAFEDTPVRAWANLLSLAALIVFVIGLVRLKPVASDEQTRSSAVVPHPSAYILVPIIALSIKLFFVDTQLTPLRQTQLQNGQLGNVGHSLQIDFGDQMRLLGYRVSPQQSPAGETLRLDLYWRRLKPIDQSYQTTAGVVDASGELWSPKTLNRPRDYQDYPAISTWPADAYVVDSFELPIHPGAPPGDYAIFAEVFGRDTLLPLPAQASAQRPASRPAAAILGPIEVTHAGQTFNTDELGIYNLRADRLLAPEIKLLGVNRDRSEVLSGDTVLLTLFWQATQKPQQDYTATIELLDDQGRRVTQRTFQLGDGRFPASQWTSGEQIVDLDRVRVPADTPGGLYRWRASIGNGEPIDLGELRVTAPARSFTEPAIGRRIDQTLGHQVTLLGYDNPESNLGATQCAGQNSAGTLRGAECKVTFYWRAAQDMPVSYKVFVHLLDANGVPRAQVDTIPVNGTRPTTSWLPGEVVSDVYTLIIPVDLPAGRYRLTAGLYGEVDGKRLTLPDGRDSIELTTIDVP